MAVALATPASSARPRSRRVLAPAATIVGLSVASLALHLRDPHDQGAWGECPSAAVGIYCPGCGGLRAVNDLTRGQVGAAASSNLLFIVAVPFVVFLLGRWSLDRWRGVERPDALAVRPWVGTALLGLVVAFTVVRNLGVGAWLAP